MTEEKKHRNLKAFKIAFITLVIFVGVQLIARYLLTTDLAHDFVKKKVTQIANEQLNGELIIGDIDGDLWKEILLTDVAITDPDEVLRADTLYAKYEIWSFIKDVYQIEQVKASGVHLFVEEEQDTVFNVQKLIKESEKPDEQPESESVMFELGKIMLRNINAKVVSPSYLPDSSIEVMKLNALASFSKTDTLNASLQQLNLRIKEGRLPDPIRVGVSGNYNDQKVTLQQLVIETGRSMLKAQAESQLRDSTTITAQADAQPFSLKDIQPYLDAEIPGDDVMMSISASGTLGDLKLKLNVDHAFAPNLEVVAGFDLKDEPAVTQFGILGDGLNIAHFTDDSIDAELGEFRVSLSGVLVKDIPSADIVWGFTFNRVRYEDYFFNKIIASGTLKDDDVLAHFSINPQGNGSLNASPTVQGVSSESPHWFTSISISDLNLKNWVNSEDLDSRLFVQAVAAGKGFSLSDSTWKYTVAISDNQAPRMISPQYNVASQILNRPPRFPQSDRRIKSKVNEQEFERFYIKGAINKDKIVSEAYLIIDSSRVDVEAEVNNFQTQRPSYSYSLVTRGFNVAELDSLRDFPTFINLKAEGRGSGLDPEDCEIITSVKIDSSVINGARFQKLDGEADFRNGILNITQGEVISEIIKGSFEGRKNLTDQSDPENWLDLDMRIKDIQPLAPLANVNRLNATGTLKGRVTQDTSQVLQGNLDLDLNDIAVDTLFLAQRIHGESDFRMTELKQFQTNLSIESPEIVGLTFQDVRLGLNGEASMDSVNADFEMEIVGSDRGRLEQAGNIRSNLSSSLTDIRFDQFDLITTASRLDLQDPFRVRVRDISLGTDTLHLQAEDGTYLKFAVPYADSTEQHAWLDGKDFDFGIMQEVIFGERFLDGVLSGILNFNRNQENVDGKGSFNLTRINYKDVEADSLALTFDIKKERLTANTSVNWGGEEHISGDVDVPFVLFEEQLTDEFYEQAVQGTLSVRPTNLERFKPLLNSFGYSETTGILSFNGSLNGTAGQPEIGGKLTLDQPVLSGIKLDTVTANFDYNNEVGGLKLNAEVIATNQKAAVIEADIPFSYDFESFEMQLPEEDDSIKIIAQTKDFNIAVFNDFLDKEYMRGLRGKLNADLELEGPQNDLEPSGYLRITEGRLNVPVAGITLEDLRSEVEFTQQGLDVKNISMKSGRGDFKATGLVALQGIIPQTLDLKANANQFRLANTADYNFVIDLNSRLTGSANTPTASGEFVLRSGFVYLDDFGENSVEEVTLEGEAESSFSPYDSLGIDMELRIDRNFFVRSRDYLDMEIEMTGTLDAQKETAGELSLFGTLNGRGGYVRPLGKLFTMQESNMTFSGPIDEPEIYVKSQHIPPTRQKGEPVVLYYIIDTTHEQPYRFESDPQMEEQDIVCYTLFGKPCYSLESWQSVFADGESFTAADVLTDVLLDEVETLATRELGVDVVQIDNTGTSGGTSIKTGWYINDKTFFAIVNEITKSTPKTMFILEYIISEKVDLILTQGDSNQRGIDIRYQHDY
jgi:autotransporter translocation and assembly factor TamB